MDKCVFCLIILAACSPRPASESPTAESLIGEARPEQWGLRYSRQYRDWKQAAQGEEPRERVADEPRLPRVLAGSAFATAYQYPRAHGRSLEDVRATFRLTERSTATCLSCKTASYQTLLAAEGDDPVQAEQQLAQRPFAEVAAQAAAPVACADCHDPVALEAGEPLRITRLPLLRAMPAAKTAPQDAQRSLVCAQCHSEYYINGATQLIDHPWSRGLRIDDMIAVYDTLGFSDYLHPLSAAPLLKLNHPSYELWYQGEHAGSHVSCTHCHMPRIGGVTSHSLQSPLARVEETCQQCHKHKTPEVAAEDVAAVQTSVGERLARVVGKLDEGHALVGAWLASEGESTRVKHAHTTLQHAQARWDFIASEGSLGFHAPGEAERVLKDAEKALDALLGATQ